MRRFETLDFLRGVAALVVLCYHIGMRPQLPQFLPHGYLAVDFFFVLSGFVVAHAYAAKLAGGMPWRDFAYRRVVRMYPLALVGVLLGLMALIGRWVLLPGKSDGVAVIVGSGLANLLLLPGPLIGGAGEQTQLFPGNGPLWSLFLELAINLVWALVAVRARTWVLASVAVLAAFALAPLAARFGGASMGFDYVTFGGGVARVVFGFTTGVLIQRLRPPLARYWRWRPVVLAGVLLAVFAMPEAWIAPETGAWVAWDVAAIVLAMPVLVAAGMGRENTGPAGRLSGRVSYALYATHYPLLAVVSGLYQTGRVPLSPAPLYLIAGSLMLMASYVATVLYDEPLRGWLSRRGRVRHRV